MPWRARVHTVPDAHSPYRQALPLVLLPGTLCDARVFDPLLSRLPGVDARVVLLREARTLEEAAEHVLGRAPERFALLGYSLGGLAAMETALQAPERVRGLALLSTTPYAVAPEHHAARRAAVGEAEALGMRRFVRERLWPWYGGGPDAAPLSLLENMAEACGPAVFARQTETALRRGDYRDRLAAVRCPALVLAGALDRVCPPAAQAALASALPGCTRVLLPGTGHVPPLESPDETASAVAAWLHAIERR